MSRLLTILFLCLIAGRALAQAPPAVPALPDTERRTSYSITGTTCNCAVNFALYGDGGDYQNWVEVYLNGVRVNYNDATYGWTITSNTGTLTAIPRPITDAVLNFTKVQTGTVQIVGARRPRRTTQFTEGQGVAARDLNQALTDIIAENREAWDKINDVTGRGLFSQPGNTVGLLPLPSACASSFLAFDATGLNPQCLSISSVTTGIVGPGSTTVGDLALWNATTGNVLKDAPLASGAATALSHTPNTAGGMITTLNAGVLGQSTAYGSGGALAPANSALNAVLFGADPTGATDSTTAINTAISTAQTQNCQDIYFPPGTYKITGLTEGNGSNTQASTVCAPKLIGLGSSSPTRAYFPGFNAPTVTLKYIGGALGTMLQVAGPVSGWGVQNITFDCNNSAGYAIRLVSAQWGRAQGIAAQNCEDYAFYETTITTNSTGLVDVETMHNSWRDVSILIPLVANAGGIWVGAGTTSGLFNSAYEDWNNVFISFNTGSVANYGLYVAATDSDVFRNFHFTAGGSGAACVVLDYTNVSSQQFPNGVLFDHFDTTGCSAAAWENNGTPGVFAFPNYVTNITEANGGVWPVGIANLYTMMGQNVGGVDLGSQSAAIAAAQLTRSTSVASEAYRLSYYLVTTTQSGSSTYNAEFFWNDGTGTQSFTSSNASCANSTPVSGTVDVYSAATDAIQYQTNISGSLGSCRYHLVVNAQRVS